MLNKFKQVHPFKSEMLQLHKFDFVALNFTHQRKVLIVSTPMTTRKLTLNVPIPNKKKKLAKIFILTFHCGALKGFMKAFKADVTKNCENKNLS